MIRKTPDGQYQLKSKAPDPNTGHHRNLGTFSTKAAAQSHEKMVQQIEHMHQPQKGSK